MYGPPPDSSPAVYGANLALAQKKRKKIGHLGGAPINAGRGNCRMRVTLHDDGTLTYGEKECKSTTKRRGLR